MDYLECIKIKVVSKAKVSVGGERVKDFEDVIYVDESKDEIDIVSNGFL